MVSFLIEFLYLHDSTKVHRRTSYCAGGGSAKNVAYSIFFGGGGLNNFFGSIRHKPNFQQTFEAPRITWFIVFFLLSEGNSGHDKNAE